jgi:hypothetical protein
MERVFFQRLNGSRAGAEKFSRVPPPRGGCDVTLGYWIFYRRFDRRALGFWRNRGSGGGNREVHLLHFSDPVRGFALGAFATRNQSVIGVLEL